ncbi:MAG: hypothetical protein ABSB87_14185 [Terriglobales bacterium]|jgi:hypothetical protein
MKQNAGLIAAATVFLAFFGFSNLPKGAPSNGVPPGAVGKVTSVTKSGAAGKSASPSSPCQEIGERLQPFLEIPLPEKTSAKKDWEHPGSCYEDGVKRGKFQPTLPAAVKLVIATVPNPILTHLPLVFDRMTEVIEQAAQDDRYAYDSSWFPWEEAKGYERFADQLPADEAQKTQQQQPGVILFRRAVTEDMDNRNALTPYGGGLIVFVVAELPTGGIDRNEFANALEWIQLVGGLSLGRSLNILGPSFSGSLPSLDQALDQALSTKKLQWLQGSPHIVVSSGSVSSQSSFVWFQNRMERYHFGSFRTAMEGDHLMVDRLLQYLNCQGYNLGNVAVISEDETAFGARGSHYDRTTCDEKKTDERDAKKEKSDEQDAERDYPISLYYPRDIATLRSAYERQSILGTGNQPPSGSATSTTLRGDLSEPNSSDHDTVRSYGGELTPLAQESVLLNIVNVLKEKRIQFVILRSTNSLDQIFLAQFLRRTDPAARIVIDGTDLLFQRGAEGASLRGVMTLSSYPLLTWQQDWTETLVHFKNGSYRIFGEDLAEGLYIAARDMFRDPQLGTDVAISNYASPSWAFTQYGRGVDPLPATWLSVIGHHQFWPVAAINSQPAKSSGLELLPTASSRQDLPVFDDDEQHPGMPTELCVVLLACTLWSGMHLLWCWRGSIKPFPSPLQFAHFAPLGAKQHSSLIAFGSFLPAAAAVVIAATCGLLELGSNAPFHETPLGGVLLREWLFLIFAASYFSCRENFRLPVVSGQTSQSWHRSVAAVALATLFVFTLAHYFVASKLNPQNEIPAYWRNAHMLSGVSAALPQLILMGGMYLWFWFSLRGLALFGDDCPLLPPLSSLPVDPENGQSLMPMFSHERTADPTKEEAIPWGRKYLGRMLGLIFVTLLIFFFVPRDYTLRTIGERDFGKLMSVWLALCMVLVLSDTAQLWTTWRKLRPLLAYLDRTPLRRTLAALRGLSWGSVWAVSGNTLEERYLLLSRQFESSLHLTNLLKQRPKENSIGESKVLDTLCQCLEVERRSVTNWYVDPKNRFEGVKPLQKFQTELAAIAGLVMTNVLVPAWRSETDSLIFDRAGGHPEARNKDQENEPTRAAVPDGVPTYVLAAEEFFVLPYLGFIQNILGRMRTIILGSLFLFVATTFAVSSYPFDPLPVLGGIFLTAFIITGGTTVLVFAQMHRDATLSHITHTRPGELGGQFWLHLITFGVGPLLGLLTTLFPAMTDFVSSWLQPGMQALK